MARTGKEELKTDNNIDLMEFISKSDFSSVGGKKSQQNENFDFEEFNTGAITKIK